MPWEEVKKRLVPGATVACHNSANVSIISGTKSAVNQMMLHAKSQAVFTHLIDLSGSALHSPLIEKYVHKIAERITQV